MARLSEHLLERSTKTSAYTVATKTHSWLQSAASGILADSSLAYWLYQDRIYASQAYPRFVGNIIARLPLERSASKDRILKTLVFSLENVIREVEFFETTAGKWRLDLDKWDERKATRDYCAEMQNVSSTGTLDDGLIFLWAMEKAYLDSWSNVNQSLRQQGIKDTAVADFAGNWSTEEFIQFVDELAVLIDHIDPSSEAGKRAEYIWDRVVELEEAFWPTDQ